MEKSMTVNELIEYLLSLNAEERERKISIEGCLFNKNNMRFLGDTFEIDSVGF